MDLKALENRVRNGDGDFKDMHDFVVGYGKEVARRIQSELEIESSNGVMTEADIRQIVSGVLRSAHKLTAELSVIAINRMYEKAGIGLKAVMPEYSLERENEIVAEIMKEYTENEPD